MASREPKKIRRITLKIGDKSYEFDAYPEQVELYRLAERQVADGIQKFEAAQFKDFTMLDYLAMVALEQTMANVMIQRSRGVGNEDMQALDELSREVDTFLNTPGER